MPLPDKSMYGQFSRYGFVFLLPLWFILHANNAYFGLIPAELSLLYLGRYLLISLAFVAAGLLFFKKKPNAGAVFSTVLFFSFFLFGALLDNLRLFTPGFFSSYKFVLPALLVFLIIVFAVLKFHRGDLFKAHRFFKWLAIVFLILEIVVLAVNVAGNKPKENDLSGDNKPLPLTDCASAKPDIFYIVFDEYPSSLSLQQDLGFNNSATDSMFASAGFFVARKSLSNYNVSPFSLSSVLDAGYLKKGIEKRSDAKLFVQALETYEDNRVTDFFQRSGYSIKNYGCFGLRHAPLKTEHYFEDMYSRMIDGSTMSSRINKDVWWQVRMKNIFTGEFRVPPAHVRSRDYHLYRNQFNFSRLKEELKLESPEPRFVIAHLMIPHEPFLLKADGTLRSDTAVLRNSVSPKEGFLDQVQYANSLLKEIVSLATKENGRQKIIVIQGDHGYRFFEADGDKWKEFRNLNAFYFPDRDYGALSDSTTSVNTFRVILNKYFCQQLPLLKDSSIFIRTEN